MRNSRCLPKVLYVSEGQSLPQFVVLYDPSFFPLLCFFGLKTSLKLSKFRFHLRNIPSDSTIRCQPGTRKNLRGWKGSWGRGKQWIWKDNWLCSRCQYPGAWVEPKGLLVALHYREVILHSTSTMWNMLNIQLMAQVAKEEREELIEMVSEIYRKHDFEFMHVSKRIENVPPVGWDRGRSSIHILRSLFGVDWEEMVQVCPLFVKTKLKVSCRWSMLEIQLRMSLPWKFCEE